MDIKKEFSSFTFAALTIVIPKYIFEYMQTTILFKTDKKLKEAAQATAKMLGVPLSSLLTNYLREFVAKKEVTFSSESYKPTPYLIKIIEEGEKNFLEGKVETYKSVDALFADLK